MIEIAFRDAKTGEVAHVGSQPIVLAAGALIMIVLGLCGIALGRAYNRPAPEQDRFAAIGRLQATAAQASEQLVEKTEALEATQQEWIDQLQVAQDQLQSVKRLLGAQQADSKRLSEQVSGLTQAVNDLRQSFSSAQKKEASAPPSAEKSVQTSSQATKSARAKRARSGG
jgi:hypothetical protein